MWNVASAEFTKLEPMFSSRGRPGKTGACNLLAPFCRGFSGWQSTCQPLEPIGACSRNHVAQPAGERLPDAPGEPGEAQRCFRGVEGAAGVHAPCRPTIASSRCQPVACPSPSNNLHHAINPQAHLGTKNCTASMERYVYRRRSDGIFVFNLAKTWEKLQLAARIIVAIENPQDIVAISARPYGQRAVLKFANHTGSRSTVGRHTPGALLLLLQVCLLCCWLLYSACCCCWCRTCLLHCHWSQREAT